MAGLAGLAVVTLVTTAALVAPAGAAVPPVIQVSTAPDRSGSTPLQDAVVADDIYVHVPKASGMTQVEFWVDDPQKSSTPARVERTAPFDLAGTSGQALPFDTLALPDGTHTVTAEAAFSDGTTSTATSSFVVDNVPDEGPDPAPVQPVRINAGGAAVSAGGVAWSADQYFTGGRAFSNPAVTQIAGTTDDALYVEERSAGTNLGAFGYDIPLPAGEYTVRLHFAEIWFGAAAGGPAGPGHRIFDVNLEGGAVEVDNLDLNAVAGPMAAHVVDVPLTLTDGSLDLDLTATVDQPTIAAIEILPAGTDPADPGSGTGPEFPATNSWRQGLSSPQAIFETAATTVEGKIYRFGGFNQNFQVYRTYSVYDPAANTWTALGTMPVGAAESHQGIATDGRYIYIAGGFAGDIDVNHNPTQTVSDRVYRYDPRANTWQQITALPQARGAGVLAHLAGKLHYISGNPADRVTNVGDHFVYDLSTKTWSTAAPLPNPKDHMSVGEVGGKIYVVGGEHGHDQYHLQQNDAHVYDPATDTWEEIASLPFGKSHIEAGSFVHEGHLYMAGGQVDNFQPTTQVIAYDVAADTWRTLSPLPFPRQGAIVQRVGDRFVLALGGIQTSQPQSSVWLSDLP